MTVKCAECNAELREDGTPCPRCSTRHVAIRPGGFLLEASLGQIGTVAESHLPEQHRIEVHSPHGTHSVASLSSGDVLELTASGRPDVGRKSDQFVGEILVERLTSEGYPVAAMPGAKDARGEDALLSWSGETITVQVTAVPNQDFWRAAPTGSASTIVDAPRGAAWVHEALSRKAQAAPTADRRNIMLAIDARHVGVLADPAIANAYQHLFGEARKEFGFREVWIVGPTASNCTRIP